MREGPSLDADCDCRRGGGPDRARSHPPRRHRPEGPHPWALFVTVLATAACGPEAPPETPVDTTPEVREGPLSDFRIRLDSESSDPGQFQLDEDDDGIRIQTGPAGIAYREVDAVLSGDMHVQARFRQFDVPPGYREAYGIFVGGIDLGGPDLEYSYLLIRPTGDFLVKRRIGSITQTLVDWTPHPSVRRVRAEGDQPVNTLGIDVFDGQTHFVVNGDVVHVESASRVRPYGVAGVRVNHRLDVRVDDWVLRRASESE